MHPLMILLYLFTCAIIAYFGRRARVGPWGVFFSCILFTPLITFTGLVLFGSKKGA